MSLYIRRYQVSRTPRRTYPPRASVRSIHILVLFPNASLYDLQRASQLFIQAVATTDDILNKTHIL